MVQFETMLEIIDYTMGTQRKRHIIGGTLMSISLLFGGLAFTVMTLKLKEGKNE